MCNPSERCKMANSKMQCHGRKRRRFVRSGPYFTPRVDARFPQWADNLVNVRSGWVSCLSASASSVSKLQRVEYVWQWSSEKALQFARVKAKSVYVLHIGRRDQIRSDLCDSSSCACACVRRWVMGHREANLSRALPQRSGRFEMPSAFGWRRTRVTRREWMADS